MSSHDDLEKQLAALERLIDDQSPHLQTYFETRKSVASLIMGYQTGATIDPDELQEKCIESEVAEAKLGVLQAKHIADIIFSLSEDQIGTIRQGRTTLGRKPECLLRQSIGG